MSLTAKQPQRPHRGAEVPAAAGPDEPAEVRFDPQLAERLRAATRPEAPPVPQQADRPALRRETYGYD